MGNFILGDLEFKFTVGIDKTISTCPLTLVKTVRIRVSIFNEPEMKDAATAEIVSDTWMIYYSASGSHEEVMVRVGGKIMKHCSGSRGVILCTTVIEMVPKANTTLSQIQQSCDIAAHAS